MIKIDLNPQKKKKAERLSIKIPSFSFELSRFKELSLIIIPVIAIGLEILYLLYIEGRISSLKNQKNQLQSEISKLEKYQDKLKEIQKTLKTLEEQKEKLNIKIKTLEYVAQYKKPLSPKINLIVQNIPDGLWLETLEINHEGAKISGYSLKPELISEYYKKLNAFYKEASFNGTEKKVSQLGVLYYNFTFDLKGSNLK